MAPTLHKEVRSINNDLILALRSVQQDAKRSGLDNLTMDEIDAEIAASRRETRGKDGSQLPAR